MKSVPSRLFSPSDSESVSMARKASVWGLWAVLTCQNIEHSNLVLQYLNESYNTWWLLPSSINISYLFCIWNSFIAVSIPTLPVHTTKNYYFALTFCYWLYLVANFLSLIIYFTQTFSISSFLKTTVINLILSMPTVALNSVERSERTSCPYTHARVNN